MIEREHFEQEIRQCLVISCLSETMSVCIKRMMSTESQSVSHLFLVFFPDYFIMTV